MKSFPVLLELLYKHKTDNEQRTEKKFFHKEKHKRQHSTIVVAAAKFPFLQSNISTVYSAFNLFIKVLLIAANDDDGEAEQATKARKTIRMENEGIFLSF